MKHLSSHYGERCQVCQEVRCQCTKIGFRSHNMLQITVSFKWWMLFSPSFLLTTWDLPGFALGCEFYLVWIQTRHKEYISHVGVLGGGGGEESVLRLKFNAVMFAGRMWMHGNIKYSWSVLKMPLSQHHRDSTSFPSLHRKWSIWTAVCPYIISVSTTK